jgi:uncharacterized ion transporter superfamily protein YfcC
MQTFRQRFFDFMSNINPLVIVFLMCVAFSLLTYIVPGGQFERHTVMVMGRAREIVVPGSFHRTPSYPQGFLQLWTVFMRGAVEGAERSFVIMLSAGSLTAIIATGAINAGIRTLIGKAGRLGIVFIPVIVFAIGLCGSTFGMYEEAIPSVSWYSCPSPASRSCAMPVVSTKTLLGRCLAKRTLQTVPGCTPIPPLLKTMR